MRGARRRECPRCGDVFVRATCSCALSLSFKTGCSRYKDVIAIRPESFDRRELGKSPFRAATCEHGDQVDRLHDEGARHGDDCFLDELLQATQRAECRAGMNGSDPAGVPGAPRLQEVERFCATHLADRDAIRPQRSVVLATSASNALTSVVFPGRGSTRDKDIASSFDRTAQHAASSADM